MFLDSSAIVPLLVDEPHSAATRALFPANPFIVWWATPLECLSAIARRQRGGLPMGMADQASRALDVLAGVWTEILPSEEIRRSARRLLLRHPLSAADALQLAAAMGWVEGRPDGEPFATLDVRLSIAARGEGFSLPLGLPP